MEDAVAELQHRAGERRWWRGGVDPQPQVCDRLARTLRVAPPGADHARACKARNGDYSRAGLAHADHRVKIPPMRASLIHRLTACLVAFCFALFSVEAAVADVHDADGSPASVTQRGHDGQPPVAPTNGGTQDRNAPGESGHPVHVCHCTHTHAAGVFAPRITVSLAPIHPAAPDAGISRIPSGREQEPLVRPPIA